MYQVDVSRHYILHMEAMQQRFCHSNLLHMKDKMYIRRLL